MTCMPVEIFGKQIFFFPANILSNVRVALIFSPEHAELQWYNCRDWGAVVCLTSDLALEEKSSSFSHSRLNCSGIKFVKTGVRLCV